jgi:hypothetical protein
VFDGFFDWDLTDTCDLTDAWDLTEAWDFADAWDLTEDWEPADGCALSLDTLCSSAFPSDLSDRLEKSRGKSSRMGVSDCTPVVVSSIWGIGSSKKPGRALNASELLTPDMKK